MNSKQATEKFKSLKSGIRRDALVKSGAYDGRYKTRTVTSKKHKDPKYKSRSINENSIH
jgi:hypothetical protein